MTSLQEDLSYCYCVQTTLHKRYRKYNERRNQFAALSIDYAGVNSVIKPYVCFNDGGFIAPNFITKTCNNELHAEEDTLNCFLENPYYFTRCFSDNLPHTMVLNTYYSPCGDCTYVVRERFLRFIWRNYPNVRILICYLKVYIYKFEREKLPYIHDSSYLSCLYSLQQLKKFNYLENIYPHIGPHVQIYACRDIITPENTENRHSPLSTLDYQYRHHDTGSSITFRNKIMAGLNNVNDRKERVSTINMHRSRRDRKPKVF